MKSVLSFLFILVASGLRVLQDFAGICRGKLGISFVFGVRGRTHNLLVPGSNPGGPTNQINHFRRNFRFTHILKLRGRCILFRLCFDIQPVHPRDVRSWNEMPISIHRNLEIIAVRDRDSPCVDLLGTEQD
jgi:hypothetical protein